MSVTVTRAKFSERQAGKNIAVNVQALSPQARLHYMVVDNPTAVVVPNGSKYFTRAPVVSPSSSTGCRVVGATVCFQTAPVMATGTATIQIDAVAADGVTTTNIVPATSLLLLTGLVAKTLAFAAAQTADANNGIIIPAGATILVTITTSNNTVGTADVGFSLTLGVENGEDAIINDANYNTQTG